MARLTPCPSCTRHVKVGSNLCPFCGGSVPVDVPVRAFAGRPLTRAAILFAGATAVSACSSSTAPTNEHEAGIEDGGFAAHYGVFADALVMHEDAGTQHDAGTPEDTGVVAHYGGVVLPDGGQGGALYGGFIAPDSGDDGSR